MVLYVSVQQFVHKAYGMKNVPWHVTAVTEEHARLQMEHATVIQDGQERDVKPVSSINWFANNKLFLTCNSCFMGQLLSKSALGSEKECASH